MPARTAIREPQTNSPEEYAQRVSRLATAYAVLFTLSLVGIALLVWQGQFFVTLSQRSNVETLVLAFLVVFFGYISAISAPGAWGALHIFRYAAAARLTRNPAAVERRKAETVRQRAPANEPPMVAINAVLAREDAPGQPFRLPVADRFGSMGELVIDGAAVTHASCPGSSSSSLLGFFVHQANQVLRERGAPADLDVLHWLTIDDEATRQYLSLVRFALNLERHLGGPELWPRQTLTNDDCRELEQRLSAVCPALRNEAFLPDWEYAAEHKLPLVPEPLGLVSLTRSERRADPEASMGCAVLVVIAVVALLVLFIVFPPWAPGL